MKEIPAEILRTIRAESPISFARYMEIALYHPAHGYYSNSVPGQDADYYTSPTLTPWFGRLVARLISEMQTVLEIQDFRVLEVGGGSGALAAAVSDSLERTSWSFVEPHPNSREVQRRTVQHARGTFEWLSSLPANPIVGCIIANEVLDNFPCRQFEIGDKEVSEVMVHVRDDALEEVLRPADPESFPKEVLAHLEPGDRFEVHHGIGDWVGQCSKALERGYLVIVDYGDQEPFIWLNRPAGTVVTYAKGKLGLNPLKSPGSADITAHVNFTHLANETRAAGFSDVANMTQRDALYALGLDDDVARIKADIEEARLSGDFQKIAADLAELSRITALVQPGAMGAFRMFVAAKNAPGHLLFQGRIRHPSVE